MIGGGKRGGSGGERRALRGKTTGSGRGGPRNQPCLDTHRGHRRRGGGRKRPIGSNNTTKFLGTSNSSSLKQKAGHFVPEN